MSQGKVGIFRLGSLSEKISQKRFHGYPLFFLLVDSLYHIFTGSARRYPFFRSFSENPPLPEKIFHAIVYLHAKNSGKEVRL
jgi:hypothetical protein